MEYDNNISQVPPHTMSTEDRLDEVAMYLMRGVERLLARKKREGFNRSLREYLRHKSHSKNAELRLEWDDV